MHPLRVSSLLVLALASCGGSTAPTETAPIADRYPGDVNIESDADVLFVEMGEESSLAELFVRWSANSTGNSIALDASTAAPGSPGHQSIRLFTTAGPGGPGTVSTAMLYKAFANGYDGTIYTRWYVKYNSNGTFHHSGIRLGGNNPVSTNGPASPAGTLPTGSDFFYLGAETSGAKTVPAATSTFDFYNYWMHQRGTSFYPGQYFGNSFVNNPAVNIDLDTWNCIEVQLTLNDPVTGYSGEIAMWINGAEVARIRQGTTGTWDEDNFTPGPGAPFEGFQWRNDAALEFTYLQVLHFVDNDSTGHVNSVNYDHVVVARKYIGPLK